MATTREVNRVLLDRLNQKEIDILRMMGADMANVAIANQLNLKVDSIKTYIGIIYEKLALIGEDQQYRYIFKAERGNTREVTHDDKPDTAN